MFTSSGYRTLSEVYNLYVKDKLVEYLGAMTGLSYEYTFLVNGYNMDEMVDVVGPVSVSVGKDIYNDGMYNTFSYMQEIKTVYDNLPKVLKNPTDVELRGVMQFSATVALNGWLTPGIQGWTPMHQMGHVLSSHFGATHGATLSCMMLAWMRYFANHKQNGRFVAFAKAMFDTEDLLLAADKLEEYIKSVGVETRISQFGCTEADLERLTDGVVSVSFSANGTLASNMKGYAPEMKSRIKVKSGSMEGVRCYSGYIIPTEGCKDETIVFSLMVNNCTAPSWKVRQLLDKVMGTLAAAN